jgi:hypothetical protein
MTGIVSLEGVPPRTPRDGSGLLGLYGHVMDKKGLEGQFGLEGQSTDNRDRRDKPRTGEGQEGLEGQTTDCRGTGGTVGTKWGLNGQ